MMDSLTHAVDEASLLLVCLSNGYQRSENCKREAIYAAELGRPMVFVSVERDFSASGWLEYIIGKEAVTDLFDKSTFADNISNVIKQIREVEDNLKGSGGVSVSIGTTISSQRKGIEPPLDYSNALEPRQETTTSEAKSYVMISYSHKQKPLIKKIVKRLREAGIKYWIDIEKLDRDILNGPSIAIEEAAAVLLCSSPDYEKSEDCKLEAENTFRYGTPYFIVFAVDGYKPTKHSNIDTMIGKKLYYQLGDEEQFEEQMVLLINALSNIPGLKPKKKLQKIDKTQSSERIPDGFNEETTDRITEELNDEKTKSPRKYGPPVSADSNVSVRPYRAVPPLQSSSALRKALSARPLTARKMTGGRQRMNSTAAPDSKTKETSKQMNTNQEKERTSPRGIELWGTEQVGEWLERENYGETSSNFR